MSGGEETVIAIGQGLMAEGGTRATASPARQCDSLAFLRRQWANLPDLYRPGFVLLAFAFRLYGWLLFARPLAAVPPRAAHAVDPALAAVPPPAAARLHPFRRGPGDLRPGGGLNVAVEHVRHVVVGSGPGGALSAALLAEAGKEVLVLEQGPEIALEHTVPCGPGEMSAKYRNGGLTKCGVGYHGFVG